MVVSLLIRFRSYSTRLSDCTGTAVPVPVPGITFCVPVRIPGTVNCSYQVYSLMTVRQYCTTHHTGRLFQMTGYYLGVLYCLLIGYELV